MLHSAGQLALDRYTAPNENSVPVAAIGTSRIAVLGARTRAKATEPTSQGRTPSRDIKGEPLAGFSGVAAEDHGFAAIGAPVLYWRELTSKGELDAFQIRGFTNCRRRRHTARRAATRTRITASRRTSTRASRSASPARSPSSRRAIRTATSTSTRSTRTAGRGNTSANRTASRSSRATGITPQILKAGTKHPRHGIAVAAQPLHVLLRQRRVRGRPHAERQRSGGTAAAPRRWRRARTSSARGCSRRSPNRSTSGPQPMIQFLTPAGEKAVAAYDPFKDDPTFRCDPVAIRRVWGAPGTPLEIVRDGDDVVLHHEWMDVRRVVHMNMKDASEGRPAQLARPLDRPLGRRHAGDRDRRTIRQAC